MNASEPSGERVERAARAIAVASGTACREIFDKCSSIEPAGCVCRQDARAALVADADPASGEGESASYWMNKCEEALKRSGENKARADAAAAEIAALRAALEPFADCVNDGWEPDELKDNDVVMVRVRHHQGYTLRVSDFRRALAAIRNAKEPAK